MVCSAVALMYCVGMVVMPLPVDAAQIRGPSSAGRSEKLRAGPQMGAVATAAGHANDKRRSSVVGLFQLLDVDKPPALNATIIVVNGSEQKGNRSWQLHFEAFMRKCLAHTRKVVHDIDQTHTDMQVAQTVEQECWLEHEFPKSASDGFETKEACHDFATLLATARETELDTGSQKGYEAFCSEFYEHKFPLRAAPIQKAAVPVLERPSLIPTKLLFVLLAAVLLAGLALFVGRGQR